MPKTIDNKLFLDWNDLEEKINSLVEKTGKEYSGIMCIATGGLVIGKLIADHTGLPLYVIAAQSYEKGEEAQKELQIGTISNIGTIKGKILLVDDLSDTGKTLIRIMEEIKKECPLVSQMSTATIYKKPHAKFTPDYYVEEIDKWVVFPYEKEEFKRLR